MGIIENTKEIAEIIRKYNDLDLYKKIIDLRDEIFELREQNTFFKEKVKELENALVIKEKLIKRGNLYYIVEGGEEKNGPFCMTCWDDDKKLINVILGTNHHGNTTFKCGRCLKLSKLK